MAGAHRKMSRERKLGEIRLSARFRVAPSACTRTMAARGHATSSAGEASQRTRAALNNSEHLWSNQNRRAPSASLRA